MEKSSGKGIIGTIVSGITGFFTGFYNRLFKKKEEVTEQPATSEEEVYKIPEKETSGYEGTLQREEKPTYTDTMPIDEAVAMAYSDDRIPPEYKLLIRRLYVMVEQYRQKSEQAVEISDERLKELIMNTPDYVSMRGLHINKWRDQVESELDDAYSNDDYDARDCLSAIAKDIDANNFFDRSKITILEKRVEKDAVHVLYTVDFYFFIQYDKSEWDCGHSYKARDGPIEVVFSLSDL